MPRILIVTPAPPNSRKGNRVTANRWGSMLRELGHHVDLAEEYSGQAADILLALHARKSGRSIARFRKQHPTRPIILALTGTDLYGDIGTSSLAQRSLKLATRLIVLQPDAKRSLPKQFHPKMRVVFQSAESPSSFPPPLKSVFEVCVCGHLRPVKDPLRTAMAARRLPKDSRIRVTHIGAALSESMERRAEQEMQRNPRYRWVGELTRSKTQQGIARSRLLVLTSKMEGGANVISESLAALTPVISSRISGSIGLLGKAYPGFFETGDTAGLAKLLSKCESEPDFLTRLQSLCQTQARQLTPEAESGALEDLIHEVST